MRKIFSLVLCLSLSISFFACKQDTAKTMDLEGKSLQSFIWFVGTGSVNTTYQIDTADTGRVFLTARHFSGGKNADPDSVEIPAGYLDDILKLAQKYEIDKSMSFSMGNDFPPGSTISKYTFAFHNEESILIYIENYKSVAIPDNVSEFEAAVSEIISELDEEYLDDNWEEDYS